MQKTTLKYMRIIPILLLAFILFRVVNQTEIVFEIYSFTAALFAPIIWAVIIAYLINPLLRLVEKHIKIKRAFSLFLVYALVLILLTGVLILILPVMFNSVTDILKDLPKYADQANNWYMARLKDIEALETYANNHNFSLEDFDIIDLDKHINNFTKNAQNFVVSIGRALFDFTSGVFKFIVGLIISIYLLYDKESYGLQAGRIARAYLGKERGNYIIELVTEIDRVFSRYLIGKTIDSLIVGVLCFIGFLILDIRYALLLAFIVGVTNMIPYFGPLIGVVPAVFITVFNSPIKALWVAIFILILQQIDGNIIGPKILGDSVGLSPLWIIVAIIIGGGLFGVIGMLIGVPVVAVIRNLINRHVEYALEKEESLTSC